MSAGKFLLHKGGDQFLEIPGGEFGPKQISPTRDTRLCGATCSGGMSGSADVGKTRTPHRHNFAWNRYDPAGAGSRLPHRHRACPSANASTFCCVRLPCSKNRDRLRLLILAGGSFDPYESLLDELGLRDRVIVRQNLAAVEE